MKNRPISYHTEVENPEVSIVQVSTYGSKTTDCSIIAGENHEKFTVFKND